MFQEHEPRPVIRTNIQPVKEAWSILRATLLKEQEGVAMSVQAPVSLTTKDGKHVGATLQYIVDAANKPDPNMTLILKNEWGAGLSHFLLEWHEDPTDSQPVVRVSSQVVTPTDFRGNGYATALVALSPDLVTYGALHFIRWRTIPIEMHFIDNARNHLSQFTGWSGSVVTQLEELQFFRRFPLSNLYVLKVT